MDGESIPLNNNNRTVIEQIKNRWSTQGKRVILLAGKVLPSSTVRSQPTAGSFEKDVMNYARSGLTLVGIVGVVDRLEISTIGYSYNEKSRHSNLYCILNHHKMCERASTNCFNR